MTWRSLEKWFFFIKIFKHLKESTHIAWSENPIQPPTPTNALFVDPSAVPSASVQRLPYGFVVTSFITSRKSCWKYITCKSSDCIPVESKMADGTNERTPLVRPDSDPQLSGCGASVCCDPRRRLHRYLVLIFICFLSFGKMIKDRNDSSIFAIALPLFSLKLFSCFETANILCSFYLVKGNLNYITCILLFFAHFS